MQLHAIILAAGQGKRMVSDKPKVLHPLAGKPILHRVVDTARQLQPEAIHVVYGHAGDLIKQSLPDEGLHWIHQEQQLGTGHAVMQALPHIPPDALVLILSADVPLIQTDTLQALLARAEGNKGIAPLVLLTAIVPYPFGLGRIVRNAAQDVVAIVEEKDADAAHKALQEIYSGICCATANDLARWLPQVQRHNAQHEYYLTDIVPLAVKTHVPIEAITTKDWMQVQGVNNQLQLQQLEREWQYRNACTLLEQGVSLADAKRLDVRGELSCGRDVFIDVNCVFQGKVILGDGCTVGPNCVLTDVHVGAGTAIHANSVLDGCDIGLACSIGPFARLRAGTQLGAHCKVGNFVETKKAVFAQGCKASHLSYLGDVHLGEQVNIGAGTITCNYDGVNKHQTIIEAGAFIGSDTQLVAPVTVGKNATIGAGSTIRKNAPAGELTYSESKQKTVHGWKRPVKKE